MANEGIGVNYALVARSRRILMFSPELIVAAINHQRRIEEYIEMYAKEQWEKFQQEHGLNDEELEELQNLT